MALQKVALEQLGENNLDKKQLAKSNLTQTEEEACKEQLLRNGFPEASLNQQPFSNSLVQPSEAKAASHPELLQGELQEEELADKNFDKKTLAATSLPTRPSTRQLQNNKLEEENFTENSFEALCLTSFPHQLQEELPRAQLNKEQLGEEQLPREQLSTEQLSPKQL